MAYACSDLVEDLSMRLHSAGYRFHNGNPESGVTVTDESGVAWWFTWCIEGMADAEVGEDNDTALAATADAMNHWFANAKVSLKIG